MHDEVGLHRPHPLIDGGTELRRPRHPVPRRKHRARPCVGSRSQRTAALATPTGHDGPTGPGPHPQPKAMHPRPAPVVGLKGPLALGHGCLSLLRMASAAHARSWPVGTRSPLVSSFVSLASRRGLQENLGAAVSPRSGDCSRVLTRFRWVKPRPALAECFTAVTAVTAVTRLRSPSRNRRPMLQNSWHTEIKLLASGNAVRRGTATRQRSEDAHSVASPQSDPPLCDEPRPAVPPLVDKRATAAVSIHNLWITMWTVRHRLFGGPRTYHEGVPVIDS